MAAVLALLSTLVAAKLQLIQQWWLPTFDILDGCTCNGNNPTDQCFITMTIALIVLDKDPQDSSDWI
jgi:hypothetical protein